MRMFSVNLNPLHSLIDGHPDGQFSTWKVTFILFRNVNNTPSIHKLLLNGEIEASLLNPTMIVDPFQVVVAANRALRSHLVDKMTTRSLYTEVLYNLSPNKKIASALQTFGISNQDKEMLAVIIHLEDSELVSKLKTQIDGDVSSLDDLCTLRNEKSIKKLYKITDAELLGKSGSLLNSVVARMACKDFPVL